MDIWDTLQESRVIMLVENSLMSNFNCMLFDDTPS